MTALELLGSTIRRFRVQHELTQEELAVATGLQRSYIASIERGGRNVSTINLLRIARALQVPPSKLLEPLDERSDLYPMPKT